MRLNFGSILLLVGVYLVQVRDLQADEKVIYCYFTSWSVYRSGNGSFDIEDIDPNLCTHIVFSFLGLQTNGSILIVDPWESNSDGLNGFQRFVDLKQQNSDLKVIVSMGGWNELSSKYSEVAADSDKRAVLINEVVTFLENYGFDGFDLSWQYPGRDGGNAEDKDNFVLLLQELKAAFETNCYILSAAVNGAKCNVDASYDVAALSEVLDHINIMTFDFHGDFDNYVGHHTLMYSADIDAQYNNSELNIDDSISYWLDQGADPAKINFGIATYARTFTLANISDTALYALITAGGTAGPYTANEGVLGYNEICELYPDEPDIYDDVQMVYHKVIDDQWIGYENVLSIAYKVEYALSKELGGFMVWSFDTDDFLGVCGDGTYPLINILKTALKKNGY